jgi:hypothetical protein
MKVYIAKLSAWAQVNITETRERRAQTADPSIKSPQPVTGLTHPPSAPR